MSGRFKGEISASADGISYKLRMDMNAFAAFEDDTGLSALDWAETAEAGKAKIGDMITMVHCTLYRHHEEAGRRIAGDILSEEPGVLARLFQASSPDSSAGIVGTPPGK